MSGIPAGAGSLLGKRLGKYEILALLALGGTAEIYLARIGGAAGFEKYVVVKCLHDHLADDQEFVKMFLDEARLAAHLDHSNIVQTMELGEHEDRYFMVMEFLAGLSLAMVVRRAVERLPDGLIPVPLVLNMMAQACAGLHYAHERAIHGKALNIVHRDISPQNLVVSFEGVVKVVDFGIAKAEQRQTATRAGTIKGKFAYMSPEQCIAANVDRRTDVFALGVIAYELLTGRRLFKRNSPYDTYQAVIECAVEPPSTLNVELDSALDSVIMRAVAKNKDDRYPTAEAFGDALLGYLHHRGKGSGPGEVARFFDDKFAQEIEEHSGRMRELISGRDFSVDTGVQWSAEDEEAKRSQTVDLSGGKRNTDGGDDDKAMQIETGDIMVDRASKGSLSDVVYDIGDNERRNDIDMPADRTRIETNPLDNGQEIEAASKPPIPRIVKPQPGANNQPAAPIVGVGPPQGRPAPHKMPPSGPLPLPAPPPGPVQQAQLAKGSQRPLAARFPNLSNLPTQLDQVPPVEPARTTAADSADPNHDVAVQGGGQPAVHGGQLSNLPTDYPVLKPEFSQQMMSGNLFPSVQPGQRAHTDSAQHRAVADSGLPNNAPARGPDSGPDLAADLISPVGPQFPTQVDWESEAEAPARALPLWMMIALFMAAIGVALVLTIVVARIIR